MIKHCVIAPIISRFSTCITYFLDSDLISIFYMINNTRIILFPIYKNVLVEQKTNCVDIRHIIIGFC